MFFRVNKYFVMGTINCKRDPLLVLEEALQAGITMFQLREKGTGALTGEAYVHFAEQCQKLCHAYEVPFIVNDDVALALKLQADGIHVGQDDQNIQQFREQMDGKIIGVSVHTERQLHEAVKSGADYVGIGPIFETKSKTDGQRAELAFLQRAKVLYSKVPVVAIGGITCETSASLREMGADGIAVISAISHSMNIQNTVNGL
ncbi:MAG: thiamine phosphate synthase [Solibacillus sp.]